MHSVIECAYCGEKNVLEISASMSTIATSREIVHSLEDVDILSVRRIEDFMENVKAVALELFSPDALEQGVEKQYAIRILREWLNISTVLAYEVLDRIKSEMGLYEKDGRIWEA